MSFISFPMTRFSPPLIVMHTTVGGKYGGKCVCISYWPVASPTCFLELRTFPRPCTMCMLRVYIPLINYCTTPIDGDPCDEGG